MKLLLFVVIFVSSICYSQETAELEISSINKIELDEIISDRNNKLLLVSGFIKDEELINYLIKVGMEHCREQLNIIEMVNK